MMAADLQGWWNQAVDEAKWGETVQVQTAEIRNTGSSASTPFQVQWYLSRDSKGSSDDILLPQANGTASYKHPVIAAGGYGGQFSTSVKLPAAPPARWTGEQFYVVMRTDSANQVQETNEDNNFGQVGGTYDYDSIKIVKDIDLKGLWMLAADQGRWGQTIAVEKAQIENAGASPSGTFKVQWYLSRDSQGSADDVMLSLSSGGTSLSHASIPGKGYGKEFSLNLKLPAARPAGWTGDQFYLVMKTDSANQVQETNENNNFGQIGGSYDYDPVSITAPPSQQVLLTNVPFVSQVLPSKEANQLCQFASAAMLMGQQYGSAYATQSMMQSLAELATGDKLAKPSGATVLQAGAAVETYTGAGTTITGNSGWLTYDEIKQALRDGHAVSVSLNYELLGTARGDHYKKNNITIGRHQVVVIGFSEKNQTWTFYDPLQPGMKQTTVSSNTFHQAADAMGGNGYWVPGWYFK